MKRLSVVVIAAVATACGGGSSSTSTPTSPSASGSVTLTVTAVAATTEKTASGVTYWTAFRVRETGGRSGVTISSIRVALANSSRNGGGTFSYNDRLTASGFKDYDLGIDATQITDLYNQVSLIVAYTDDSGVAGVFTSSSSAISAPPASPAPAPAPAPTPGAGQYDATYDFFFKNPGPGGTTESHSLARFLIVRNSIVSSSDGTISGTVDGFGAITFTGPCTINNSVADWTGKMNALAGSKSGQGQYTCRIAIGGGSLNSWQALQAQ